MTNNDELALKPGTYAILFRDNWDGEGDVYKTLATLGDDLVWYHHESWTSLIEYEGDEVLKVWPLDDGSNALSLLAERDADKKRIAELEARTVSVKLPKISTERQNWTAWDWIEHLGGRCQNGNPGDYIEFGSVYAVQQMLKQFARTVYAQCQSDVVAQIEKQLAESGIKLEVGE